jgi:uncharacterized protein YecT (DUF1311 family)
MQMKPFRTLVALIANLALAGALFAASSAMADSRPRTLRAVGQGPAVMLTDCEDCGDDTGMTIECKGPRMPAQVEVPWAAMKQGVEGAAAPVVFEIAGQTYTYPARTLHYDAVGYLPAFKIRPGDRLLAAMQSGAEARVRFGDATTTISVLDAQSAIDTFVTNCWGQGATAQPVQQPVNGSTDQTAPTARPSWCASQNNFNRAEMTICANSDLWQLDNQMARTYQDAINEYEAVRQKFGVQGQTDKLKSEQVHWLRTTRNGCQGDVACLQAVYRQRIEDVTPRGD